MFRVLSSPIPDKCALIFNADDDSYKELMLSSNVHLVDVCNEKLVSPEDVPYYKRYDIVFCVSSENDYKVKFAECLYGMRFTKVDTGVMIMKVDTLDENYRTDIYHRLRTMFKFVNFHEPKYFIAVNLTYDEHQYDKLRKDFMKDYNDMSQLEIRGVVGRR